MTLTPFNVNSFVRVKLNQRGLDAMEKHYNDLRAHVRSKIKDGSDPFGPWKPPEVDAQGFARFQLWDLMQQLGGECALGCNPPFETEIMLEHE